MAGRTRGSQALITIQEADEYEKRIKEQADKMLEEARKESEAIIAEGRRLREAEEAEWRGSRPEGPVQLVGNLLVEQPTEPDYSPPRPSNYHERDTPMDEERWEEEWTENSTQQVEIVDWQSSTPIPMPAPGEVSGWENTSTSLRRYNKGGRKNKINKDIEKIIEHRARKSRNVGLQFRVTWKGEEEKEKKDWIDWETMVEKHPEDLRVYLIIYLDNHPKSRLLKTNPELGQFLKQ